MKAATDETSCGCNVGSAVHIPAQNVNAVLTTNARRSVTEIEGGTWKVVLIAWMKA